MITKFDKFILSFMMSLLIASILMAIGRELIKMGVFTAPIITTYPWSWPMVVTAFALLFIGWMIGRKGPMFEFSYVLLSAILGLLAAIIATPKACTAGFNGFNMLALLLLVKPVSSLYFGGYLRPPMPRWAIMLQGAFIGATIYALIAVIASYQLPPPPK